MERLAVRAALRRVAYSVYHAHVPSRQADATTTTVSLRSHFTDARSRPRARSSQSSRSSTRRATRGAAAAADDDDLGQDGTAESIRQLVRDAVLSPLGESDAHTHSPIARSPAAAADDSSVYQVNVFDRNGMPAELPSAAPQSFEDLLSLTPDPLRRQLQEMMEMKHWTSLTSVQKHVVPFILEYRDVLCIAPTATGKTFAYVFPTMLRLLLDEPQEQKAHTRVRSCSADGGEDEAESLLQRRDVERLLQEKINKGEVCRYCELDVRENRVCPMTGSLHAPPQEDGDDGETHMGRERRAQRLDELSSTASPKVLVLVPTSQLAYQVHGVFQMVNCDVTIRYLVRASSAEEQRKHLLALQDGVDVLITTPETLLPALFKRKLSLQQVRTIVMDEVDDLVSVNHYDKLKIILGALPRASAAVRPQRLLFGASLPPAAYKMLVERTLQPSHRFILADVRRDSLGRPVTASRVIVQHNNSNSSTAVVDRAAGSGVIGSSLATTAGHTSLITVNASIQHFVMMLGRVEKLHKLAWLYQTGKLTFDQRVIIFCNSRHNVAYVADHLPRLVPELSHITTITSHASSTARAGVMRQFTSGLSTCLVATDIMSRGIDFKDVVYVVNYDMPLDMETFVHRCGRCGRRQPSQWMSAAPQQQQEQRAPRQGKSEEAERHESTTDALDDLDTQTDADAKDTPSSSPPSALAQLPPALTRGTSGYVYTFFQPENIKLAKPLVAYLRQNGQLVPPMLSDYARRSFVDVFRNSLFHQPTRPYRKSDPQNSMPVDGRAAPRYPDYKQDALNRNFRPL